MTREDALEIIRKNMPSDKSLPVYEALQTLVPELAESEDERIRKEIIHYILYKADGVSEEQEHSWITYLEKQKDLDKMIVVSPEVWDDAISDAYENGKKDGEKQKEQKPEWSEGFEQNIRNLLHDKLTWHSDDGSMSSAVFIDDKTIKDIVTGIWFYVGKEMMKNPNMELPKPELGEEDEDMLWNIISIVGQSKSIQADEMLDWLKSLRPQPKKELSIEKAIQWLDDTFYFLDNSSGRGPDYEITTHDFDSLEEMYDSFRKAVTVDSQPSWKPSEEQMEAVKHAYNSFPNDCPTKSNLRLLYHDLEKLGVREEPEYYQHFDPDC